MTPTACASPSGGSPPAMSEPQIPEDDASETVSAGTPPEDVTPAFDVDLPPDEQGTAEAAAEQSG